MVMRSSSLDRTRQFFKARRDTARVSGRLLAAWLGGSSPGRPDLASWEEPGPGPELAWGRGLVAGTAPPALSAGLRAVAWGARAGRAPGRGVTALRTCLARDATVSEPLTW